MYPGVNGAGRRILNDELMWLPRVAAAYQVSPRTVIRTGFGMFYDSLNAMVFAPNQLGYSRDTSTNLTNDFGVNWLAGDRERALRR